MSSDWSFTADFTNVTAAGMGGAPTEECYCKVKLYASEIRETAKGAQRVVFRCMVTEGKHASAVITDGQNFPTPENQICLRYWKALLTSIGVTAKALAKKEVKINGTSLMGREGFVHFIPAPEGGYSQVRWLSAQQFKTLSAKQVVEEPEAAPAKKAKKAKKVAPIEVDAAPEEEPEVVPVAADSDDPLDFLI